MNEIDELTQIVTEEEPEPMKDTSPLRNSTFAYHTVVIVLDIISGAIVGYMTLWFYGVIWFLAGAIAFFQHHKNWESSSNNDFQQKNSEIGMMVSVGAVVLMAFLSGGILIATQNNLIAIQTGWISLVVEIMTVSLFCWNGFQFAMYRFKDDSFVTARQIAKAKAIANKKIEFAKAAGAVVAANKKFMNVRDEQRGKHGAGAVDAALSRIEGKPVQQRVFAKDEELPELVNPTKAGSKQE